MVSKIKINLNTQPTEQDILILFDIINNMSAPDALKAINVIKDNPALLDKLSNDAKYSKVALRARTAYLSLTSN